MELSDFITDTLNNIKKGVKDANSDGTNHYYMVGNYKIEFDVLLVAEKSNSSVNNKGGSGKIRIGVLEAGGDAKGNKSSESKNSNSHKIHFSVGVDEIIQ